MKKFLMIAAVALAALTVNAQNLRVEAGFITGKQKVESTKADDAMTGFKIGGYYMLNDVVIENGVVEAGVTFGMASLDKNGYKQSFSRLGIPVNAGYKIVINDDMSVRPYAGISVNFNMTGKTKYTFEGKDYEEKWFDGDYACRRLQLGGQIGGVFQWKNYTASYQMQTDFTGLENKDIDNCKTTFPHNVISVGIIF